MGQKYQSLKTRIMDLFEDDMSSDGEFRNLESDIQDYGEMSQETIQLLQRKYELPDSVIISPLSHFSSLYHSDSFLHNILSIYWLPSFLQTATMDEISNHLLGQLRLMACTRTNTTRCGLLIRNLFPEKDVMSSNMLGMSHASPLFPPNDDFSDDSAKDGREANSFGPADPFMDGIFRSLTLGKVQARDLSSDERLSLLKYLLCFHFEDMAKAIMRNQGLSAGQRDYVVRNVLCPLLKCIIRSTPCYDTMRNIIRVLYTFPSVAEAPIDQKLCGLLLFREIIFFQFCRCLSVFCNLTFKYDSEANIYCCIHSLFGGVVSRGLHTENYPPSLRCRCRYKCTCTQDNDEYMEQLEQSMAHNASWNDCYTLSFHSSWSEKYGVETSRVVKAQSQIFHQEKKILASLPELEDVLLNLIDVMVHYSISYCISPDLCNALFILMGRISTDRTLHSAFLKEFGDILNSELTKTFYQRLDLTVDQLWEFQKPMKCQHCHQDTIMHDTAIDTSCCDIHRFLDPPFSTRTASELFYTQSQLSNLIKPVTEYSYQNIESTIVSPKIQRAAILNMSRILYVYTAKSGHSRTESLQDSNEIAYRQSPYVTFAEQSFDKVQEVSNQDSHQLDALKSNYSKEYNFTSLPPQRVTLSALPHDGETETEVETGCNEHLEYFTNLMSSPSSTTIQYTLEPSSDAIFSLRSYLSLDTSHHQAESTIPEVITPSLISMSTPANTLYLYNKKAKPIYLKNTEMKLYSQTDHYITFEKESVVATNGMQNDVISFVRDRLYSKDNIPNLVFCAEALPLFCRAFTFRKRVRSLAFTFVKLMTNVAPAVQHNACRNLGSMLAGISKSCVIMDGERVVIQENYLIRFLFTAFCNLLTVDKLSGTIQIPLNLDKSSINKELLECYENPKVSPKESILGTNENAQRPLLPQPASPQLIKPSKSMLTILIQGDDKDMLKNSSTSKSDTTDTDQMSQNGSSSSNILDTDLSVVVEEPTLDKSHVKPSYSTDTTIVPENRLTKNDNVKQPLSLRNDKITKSGKNTMQFKESFENFSHCTENHIFHLKKLLSPSVLSISHLIHKDIELSLLRTLPGVYETISCSHDYQNRLINIIISTLQNRASNQSTLHSLISSLPGIYSDCNTTQDNREALLQCLESLLMSPQCTKDVKIVFLYSFTKYSMTKAETRTFLLRFINLLIKIYYDILQLSEEVRFHQGKISTMNNNDQVSGIFYLQCTSDLYVSITPVSFSSHTALNGSGLYGFVDTTDSDTSHHPLSKLVYTEIDTKQWASITTSPIYQYCCTDAPSVGYNFFVNSNWRYRCDVVETLVKIVAQFCTIFDVQTGFYLFSSIILHCIKDDCQTVSECFVRLLGLELTPLLQKVDKESSIPLGILVYALFGYTYMGYGVNYPLSNVSDKEYSHVSYARLCHHFLLPAFKHQKLGVRMLHHISRRVYKYDWFARLFLTIILSIPTCDSSVQLSFVISTLNLSKKRKLIVFSEEHLNIMRLCGECNPQAAKYVENYLQIYQLYFQRITED